MKNKIFPKHSPLLIEIGRRKTYKEKCGRVSISEQPVPMWALRIASLKFTYTTSGEGLDLVENH